MCSVDANLPACGGVEKNRGSSCRSELLTPTLITGWKAAMFTSQVYTQVFPLGCLPSIVCDRCSGAALWSHRCGAQTGDGAWRPFFSSPCIHTNTSVSYSLALSPNHRKCFFFFFPPKWCLCLALPFPSHLTRLPGGAALCHINLEEYSNEVCSFS